MTTPREDLPALYRDLFEDDRRGAAILEDLVARFAKPAVTRGGIDAVLETYRRAGMRYVIDHIVTQIDIANGVRPINVSEPDEVLTPGENG